MQKKTLMKKWGTGVLTGVLVLGSLTPVIQPYQPVSAAENTLKQLQASGQGSVSDVMFEDLNGNGKQDAGENTGIAGIKVELHNDQGTLVGTATTGADGRYSFTDLPDGTYYLHVDMSTLPTDEKLYTTEGINGSDGNSTYFTITNGNAVTGYHFGFYPNEAPKLGSVSDVMFEDLNGNTSQDTGEKGVAGIKVELRNTQGELIATTTTGADGRYTFSDVSDGQYYIHVDLTTIPKNEKLYTTEGINGADGNSSYFTVSNGNAITGFHFGFYPQQGAIQSYVYNDANGNGQKDGGEAGISGVHIALYNEAGTKVADATTDSAGAYHFDALDPGRYYAKADIPSNYKYQSSTYFGADGTTGYFSVASEQTIHNELNLGLHTVDNSAVSGKVTDASTGAGLADTRVELHDVQGNLVEAQQTDASGNYNFTNVSEGNYYTKVIIPSGYEYASSNGYGNDGNSNYIQLNGENTASGYSIALRKQVTNNSAISGKVTDAATGAGLPNTRVELHDVQGNTIDTQQTDASGNYNFTGLAAGDYYTKVVIPSDYDFASSNGYGSDGNSNYIQLDGQNTSSNYTIALRKQANTTISGVINTPSGQGVSENVSLYNVDGTLVKTVSTNSQGQFSFDGVAAGNYYVKASIPEGYTFESSEGFGSDGNSYYLQADGTSNISNLRLTLAQKTGQIRSTVFNDLNKNGTQEAGESGIAGATVTLYSNTGAVVETTTTDANGLYKFETITPGTYYVKVTAPTGYDVLANTAFGDDGVSGYININAEQTRTDMNASLVATADPTAVANAKWIYHTGFAPDTNLAEGGEISVSNTYKDGYNNNNVDVAFYNSSDKIVDPSSYTTTLSNPDLFSAVKANGTHIAFTHTEKTGSSLVTVKDASGKVVRTFTITITADPTAVADMKWTYNKDGSTPVINNNGTIDITNKYKDLNNYNNVNVQFYNQAGATLDTTGWTTTLSDPSLVTVKNTGSLLAFTHTEKTGSTLVTVKNASGEVVRTFTLNITADPTAVADMKWTYNKDGSTPVINDNGTINITNAYKDLNNYNNVNVQFYNQAGATLDTTGWTTTLSDPSLVSVTNSGSLLAFTHTEKTGSTLVTVKDASGAVVRTFTLNITQSNAVTDVKWNFNKDGVSRPVNNNGVLEIPNTYMNQYNKPHVDLQFYNSTGTLVQPAGYTVSFSDPSIATADLTDPNLIALVHNDKAGSTNVTIRDMDGNIVRSFTFKVTSTDVAATDLTLATSNITANVNDTGKIDATVAPSNATNKTLSYTPADPSIITVDANGNWTAKKAGTTTIAVKTTDGSNITKTINVTVADPNAVASMKWIYQNGWAPDTNIANGDNITVSNTYKDGYGNNQIDVAMYNSAGTQLDQSQFTYTLSNPSLLSVRKATWLTVFEHTDQTGSTLVTAKDAKGNTVRTFTINITGPTNVLATDLTLGASNITANVNDTGKIDATVAPSNATNKTLSYTPADPSIITVDANGNWTAKKAGTTTIAVKTTDGSNITKTINVTVNKSIADRVGSVDFELVLGRGTPSANNAYVYPHVADVPAGVTYRVVTTFSGYDGTIQVGTSDGTYHQEIRSYESTGAWGYSGTHVKLVANYQGVDYVVAEGDTGDFIKPAYSNHVFTD
ncbi:SdrD B-like domain-containing protein [Listeria riparia]|uniref:Putative collagen-binding protein n=1 Tax=Listeria riparia FSL S10-1204 TaxID=1265816 RepID=W7D0M0_9LIST|nr:SdrD B-like domain-containing protein [Listeria riparia]EUJ42727.1 putative collagen-binding protein [Listeria riparia FSL S10-1204]